MFAVDNIKLAINGWRQDPVRMVSQVIISGVVGQAIFWNFGYDQLGVAMDPKKQFGVGQAVAARVYPLLPETSTVAWTAKVLEIVTDFARGPIEAIPYVRYGITPDAAANLFTQPVFSTAEAAEKTIGAIVRPERVVTPEGVKLSIACIYGSLFRMTMTGLLLVFGRQINRYGTRNIERAIHVMLRAVRRRP